MSEIELSIIIPTIKYTKYLDIAISSCLNLKFVNPIIFVNINSNSNDFEKSIFWKNSKVNWRYSERSSLSMYESINDAIDNSYGEWLFILSDDDVILSNFLKGIDINQFNIDSIFLNRINVIDENGNLIRTDNEYSKNIYNKSEVLDLYFENIIHNHLSLMVFSRSAYEKANKFSNTGYPNGYYIDTVFHGKLLASSDKVYTSNEVMFSRRESSFQESSNFYFGKEVNYYFNLITNNLFENTNFKNEALKRYSSKKRFCKKMLQNRFKTEWYKLNKPVFNKNFKYKIEFLFKYLKFWKTGIFFKIYSIFYAFSYVFWIKTPSIFKNYIKKLLN